MDMLKITARWTGFPGAPGYSNFFFAGGGGLISDANQVAQRVMDAFSEVVGQLAPGTIIRIEPEAAVVDSETGTTTGYRNISDVAGLESLGTGNYAGPAGAVVTWRTSDLRFGRRIKGRTFLVPLSGNAFDADGTINGGTISDLQAFAATLVGGDLDSEFGIWSRPRDGAGGVFATVDSFSIPDRVAVLRSRRD